MLSSVDLPQPLAPTMQTNSPSATFRLTRSSARTVPARLRKLFDTFSIASFLGETSASSSVTENRFCEPNHSRSLDQLRSVRLAFEKTRVFSILYRLSINSFGTAVVNLIRFHAGETASGAKVVFVSAASSSISSFCASSGFFWIQSVNSAFAATIFFAKSRWLPRNFALETSQVVIISLSSRKTRAFASRSKRVTHGSTVHTASTPPFCNSAS